jgi:hypothetical protein
MSISTVQIQYRYSVLICPEAQQICTDLLICNLAGASGNRIRTTSNSNNLERSRWHVSRSFRCSAVGTAGERQVEARSPRRLDWLIES